MGKAFHKRAARRVIVWGQFEEMTRETVLQESSSKIRAVLGVGAGGISTEEDLS